MDKPMSTQWVIVDGGKCMPANQVTPDQNPQPVKVEWIEESRRGWAEMAKHLKGIAYAGQHLAFLVRQNLPSDTSPEVIGNIVRLADEFVEAMKGMIECKHDYK